LKTDSGFQQVQLVIFDEFLLFDTCRPLRFFFWPQVVFARRLRPTLLLHTTCARFGCTRRASCVAASNKKNKTSVQSESGSRMGEGRRRCRNGPWDERAGGVHKGHFHIPAVMVERGGGRQSICKQALHMPQRSILSWSKGL